MAPNKIKIQATVLADIKKAWDYYTQTKHITNWNFASDDWCCPSVSNDMIIGGKYIARMEAKDGSFGFDFEATYNEIVDKEKFSYTSPDNREVNVSFKQIGDNTEVTIIFDAENENSIELQRNGWQAILNNYKKYTETN
jgi:uncharacterized protein YndB with AHSA1/START domain